MPPPPMPANSAAPRIGCRRQPASGSAAAKFALPRLPVRIGIRRARRPGDGDEARAEALQAGQIDVAAGRIDAPLAAERRSPPARSRCSPTASEQSPQFSHTCSLITTLAPAAPSCRACGGDASRWRRPDRRSAPRRRRTRAASRCTASSVSRVCRVVPFGSADGGGRRSASSATMAMRATPSAATCAARLRDAVGRPRLAARRSSPPRR